MQASLNKHTENEKIIVKFLSRIDKREWIRNFTDGESVWGQCEFIFNPGADVYDWLVVYDDLPPAYNERFSHRKEILRCPPQHTILVTTEPSSIKIYGSAYVSQFGCVLTSQEPDALKHPDRIYSQPALRWFYGIGKNHALSLDTLKTMGQPTKTRTISTVCSNKKQKHTLHNKRYNFTQQLKARLDELDVFGHGVRDMDDKAISLDNYKYHIAIENFIGKHAWTEKLADAFLGYTLPFYYGCPNADEYFPPESFIPIDINDFESAYNTIISSIENNEYEKRLPYIIQARNKLIDEYNIFSVLNREIVKRHKQNRPAIDGQELLSRRLARKQHPVSSIGDLVRKSYIKISNYMR